MSFELLQKEVEKGIIGKNESIPMGFDRLNRYIGIRKSLYFLIGGLTGSGKTSFLDDCFVLNPCEYILSAQNKTNIKLKIIYYSMERNRTYKLAKWVSRKIFLDYGIIISMSKLLGWNNKEKLSKDEHDLFLLQKDYIEGIEEIVTIIDGPENPIKVAMNLRIYAESHGTIEQLDKYNKIYIPNDEDVVTIIVIDHVGLLLPTKDYPTKKQSIDKLSNELRHARDFYGYTPVIISQFNRDIANPFRIKNGDVEPQLEDFADSSQTQNDADIVLSLFDPMRYKVADPSGYNLDKLKDEWGNKYFRSLRVIKNTYGGDDVRIGLAFAGEIGLFKELKKMKEMQESDYNDVTTKQFFLK